MFPDVYLFNPTCEYAVANGTVSWQPNRLLQKMESDLATLTVFFSKPNDIILVKDFPSKKYIYSLENIGITNRRFVTFKEAFSEKFQIAEKFNHLFPWGWSPAAHHILTPLKPNCSHTFKKGSNFQWIDEHKTMAGKYNSSKILETLLTRISSDFLLPKELIAKKCKSLEEIEIFLNKWGSLMVKAPWSASGRGLQTITINPIPPSINSRILGLIKKQGFVMVEPFLQKKFDMAFQFKSKKGKISYIGTDFFQTDKKGRYQGNYINGFPENIKDLFSDILYFSYNSIIPGLIETLEKEGYARNYEGYFGVDTLIYKDTEQNLRINPCLEINLRFTMGLLSLFLQNHILQNKKGIFKIFYNPGKSFKVFTDEMLLKHPPKFKGNKLFSGYFPLTDSFNSSIYGAYLFINT
ncbi:MAG: hypothetical protein HQ541_22205 [Mariniphaga sp.]|nr:hypothetical protein [Mariniphaga sp.]